MSTRPRIALVVGIDSQPHSGPLATTTASQRAKATADLLRQQANFQVDVLIDPSREQLMAGFGKFEALATSLQGPTPRTEARTSGCLAVFYYAGPLVSYDEEFYIVPADWEARLEECPHLEWALQVYGCRLNYMLEGLDDAYAGIVIVDADHACTKSDSAGCADTDSDQCICSVEQCNPEDRQNHFPEVEQNQLLLLSLRTGEETLQSNISTEGLTALLHEELRSNQHGSILDVAKYVAEQLKAATDDNTLEVHQEEGDASLFQSIQLAVPCSQTSPDSAEAKETIRLAKLLSVVHKPWQKLARRQADAEKLLSSVQGPISDTGIAKRLDTLVDLGCLPLLTAVLQEVPASTADAPCYVQLKCTVCKMLELLVVEPSYCELLSLEGVAPLLLDWFLQTPAPPSVAGTADPPPETAWSVLQGLVLSRAAKISLISHDGVAKLVGKLRVLIESNLEDTLGSPEMFAYTVNCMRLLGDLLAEDPTIVGTAVKQANAIGGLDDVLKTIHHSEHINPHTEEGLLLLSLAATIEHALKEGGIGSTKCAFLLAPYDQRIWYGFQMAVCVVLLVASLILWGLTGQSCKYVPVILLVVGFLVPDPWTRLNTARKRPGDHAQHLPTAGEAFIRQRMSESRPQPVPNAMSSIRSINQGVDIEQGAQPIPIVGSRVEALSSYYGSVSPAARLTLLDVYANQSDRSNSPTGDDEESCPELERPLLP